MVVNHALKFVFAITGLLFAVDSNAASQAQLDAMRAKSLAYLVTQQQGDGSWRDNHDNGIIATAISIDALVNSGMQTGYVSGSAASWLMNAEATSTDSLSRQITALSKLGVPVDDLVTKLLSFRNQLDYGWGAYNGYQSSMPDTALAYEALLAAKIQPATDTQLSAITSLQASDGGWPYLKTSEATKSAISPTSYGILVLSQYAKFRPSAKVAIESNVTNAINWIISRKKNDGGFADDLDSSGNSNATKPGQVLETGLVQAALLAAKDAGFAVANTSQVNQALIKIDDFFVTKQNSDGSFDKQIIQTANATQAMPLKQLVDSNRDGIPDSVATLLNLADGRDLPKGNGNPLNPASPNIQNADVPLPLWAIVALGASLLGVTSRNNNRKN